MKAAVAVHLCVTLRTGCVPLHNLAKTCWTGGELAGWEEVPTLALLPTTPWELPKVCTESNIFTRLHVCLLRWLTRFNRQLATSTKGLESSCGFISGRKIAN